MLFKLNAQSVLMYLTLNMFGQCSQKGAINEKYASFETPTVHTHT